MDVKKCDRCGNFFVAIYGNNISKTNNNSDACIKYSNSIVKYKVWGRFILCPECNKAFKKFMKGGDK